MEQGTLEPYYKPEVLIGWDVITQPEELDVSHLMQPQKSRENHYEELDDMIDDFYLPQKGCLFGFILLATNLTTVIVGSMVLDWGENTIWWVLIASTSFY